MDVDTRLYRRVPMFGRITTFSNALRLGERVYFVTLCYEVLTSYPGETDTRAWATGDARLIILMLKPRASKFPYSEHLLVS